MPDDPIAYRGEDAPRVVTDLRITEYTDGSVTNECELRQEGDAPYLDVAKRCITALGGGEDDLSGTTSISDVLHELTDLVERAEVDEPLRHEALHLIGEIRSGWPYNVLVRRLAIDTGEPLDAR